MCGLQDHNYLILIFFKPVVTEVDVERLASVAVQEVCVHSQAHLVHVDLPGQTQSDFAFLWMCHHSLQQACQFTSAT